MRKLVYLLLLLLFLTGCNKQIDVEPDKAFNYDEIAEYNGDPYVLINDNIPYFEENEKSLDTFEEYSPLDELGRCQVAFANLSKELMPEEPRESINSIKPSGWHSIDYIGIVDAAKLYNRCHLIAFKLAGENANELNLITGTRYLNNYSMALFEDQVYNYIIETENHVLYRVTPVFIDDELVCRGLLMEGYSIEDKGEGICFNVFVYNVQPLILIDYKTGDSKIDYSEYNEDHIYALNTNSKKIHQLSCSSLSSISKKNLDYSYLSAEQLIKQGYKLCNECN